jgi:hypothetical protein
MIPVYVHTAPSRASQIVAHERLDNYCRVYRAKEAVHLFLFSSQDAAEVQWARDASRRFVEELGGAGVATTVMWRRHQDFRRYPAVGEASLPPEPMSLHLS